MLAPLATSFPVSQAVIRSSTVAQGRGDLLTVLPETTSSCNLLSNSDELSASLVLGTLASRDLSKRGHVRIKGTSPSQDILSCRIIYH